MQLHLNVMIFTVKVLKCSLYCFVILAVLAFISCVHSWAVLLVLNTLLGSSRTKTDTDILPPYKMIL